MLATNKPLMDAKFDMLVKKGSAMTPDIGGAVYKAAYHAYIDNSLKKLENTSCSDEDLAPLVKAEIEKAKNELRNEAHDFASLFTDAMSECLKEISTQIDTHIKSAQIDITTPVLPTVISPMGPCSGTLTISSITGAQINIS